MRYTHAILARIPDNMKTEKKLKLNIESMRKQQEDLAETLRESGWPQLVLLKFVWLGLKIIDIDTPEGSAPHVLHVDNAAIMINGTALIAQPKEKGLNIGEVPIFLENVKV